MIVLVITVVMNFGLLFIVAMALNFMYGTAGVPFTGCSLPLLVGGMTVSVITTRLVFFFVEMMGVGLLPYASGYDWVYNNDHNVNVLINEYLSTNPVLCITLLLFTLAVSVALGAAAGWVISTPTTRLRSTHIMIVMLVIADAFQLITRNFPALSGGKLGLYVPDLLAFYGEERRVVLAVITLVIGLVVLVVIRSVRNSPYGRLMRAIRENELVAGSVGKDVAGIRRDIIVFGSGIMALSGVLLSFYYTFVIQGTFSKPYWVYWPWVIIIIGGLGNDAGTFLGTVLVVSLRHLIIMYKWSLNEILFFPSSYFLNMLLGILMLISMIFLPRGIIHEKPRA